MLFTRFALTLFLALILAAPAAARITRIDIERVESPAFEGRSFGSVGQYEKLVGRAVGEVDPAHPLNRVVVNLDRAPRIGHSGSSEPTGSLMRDGGMVLLESGFPYETVRELMSMGHRVRFGRGSYGGYQAIMFDARNGVYLGASESRKDGHAAGY